MEELKPLDEMSKPDPRMKTFAKYYRSVDDYRPFEVKDIYQTAAEYHVNESAPEEIRNSFAIAQNMYAYSWYYYPLNSEAGFLALRTTEQALKTRMNMRKAKIGLSALVSMAVKRGLLSEDGYTIPEPSEEYKEMIKELTGACTEPPRQSFLERLPKMLAGMRNSPAHVEVSIHPMGALMLRISAETINQLYPIEENGIML